jgi:Icc-related predicted phosphoesterase
MTAPACSPARVQIAELDETAIREVHYLNAGSRGSTEVERLPILRGSLLGPLGGGGELDALIVCSDLQGIVPGPQGRSELLGVHVAAALAELAADGGIPPAPRTGVILAGDLFSVAAANKRGGYGDVAEVWGAFAGEFAWVAGVAGNHDDVSNVGKLGDRVHLLDGSLVELDGLRIGGVGGIIGNPRKPGRRSEVDQLRTIEQVLDQAPDLLVLHEGPHGDDGQRGNNSIRGMIETGAVGLTICGHDHWRSPLARHAAGQILNVDARAVVLVAPR